jgi:hypothetical protein
MKMIPVQHAQTYAPGHVPNDELLANEVRRLLDLPDREFWCHVVDLLAERRLSGFAAELNGLLEQPRHRVRANRVLKRMGLYKF